MKRLTNLIARIGYAFYRLFSNYTLRNAILKGGAWGFLFGTIFYALLSVRIVLIKVFGLAAFYLSAEQYLWMRIAVIIFFVLFGSLTGWWFGRWTAKKQAIVQISPKSFFIEWGVVISIFIISIIFYSTSLTPTYECKVNTIGFPLGQDKCYAEKLLCDKVTDENIKILCHYKKSDLNINICNETNDLNEKNRCLGLVAGVSTNPTICNRIEDRRWRDFCYIRTAVYDGVKNGKWNPNLCEQITDENTKDDCYGRASQLECNASWCQKINNNAIQNSCLGAMETITQGIGCEQNLLNININSTNSKR